MRIFVKSKLFWILIFKLPLTSLIKSIFVKQIPYLYKIVVKISQPKTTDIGGLKEEPFLASKEKLHSVRSGSESEWQKNINFMFIPCMYPVILAMSDMRLCCFPLTHLSCWSPATVPIHFLWTNKFWLVYEVNKCMQHITSEVVGTTVRAYKKFLT
jgi:hypothetical protein